MHFPPRVHSLDYLAISAANKYEGGTPRAQRDLMCLELFSGVQSVANGFRASAQNGISMKHTRLTHPHNLYLHLTHQVSELSTFLGIGSRAGGGLFYTQKRRANPTPKKGLNFLS